MLSVIGMTSTSGSSTLAAKINWLQPELGGARKEESELPQ